MNIMRGFFLSLLYFFVQKLLLVVTALSSIVFRCWGKRPKTKSCCGINHCGIFADVGKRALLSDEPGRVWEREGGDFEPA